ncbi:MAG: DUF1015 domain-containing protein [Proteobacteria bacterium]|nr:DUF1015 domain-containing protein [Pseudomonadota bacterium]
MADVVPFKGILYNPDKIDHISHVVSPPYDVIPPEKQIELHHRHPQNVVRLILGSAFETDTKADNPHTRSAAYFQSWMKDNILIQDSTPSFYLTSVSFVADGKKMTRYGLMALVALEPFSKGIILPHEQTFSKVKSERLELLKLCKANFSPIFTFYPDEEGFIHVLKDKSEKMAPVFDFEDDVNERHRLWRISDNKTIEKIHGFMKDKRLFIADGHHRYETALNYRDGLKENDPDFSDTHPANFIMMYLCSMEDEGLVIFPAHRMVTQIDKAISDSFFDRASEFFDLREIPFEKNGYDHAFSEMMTAIKKETSGTVFGVSVKGRTSFDLLYLKPDVIDNAFDKSFPDVLKHLDVTVLTHLIFSRLLDISHEKMDEHGLINYSSKADQAVSQVASGQAAMAFIMNPAKIKQVQDIAQSGLIMPRKTTYFYPKAITGLVMNKLTR